MTITFAKELADASGTILKKYWGKLTDIQSKSASWDLVTEADKESEALILKMIHEKFPKHGILSEESGLKELKHETEYLWVVDPLDGTTNYTHQYPWVCVSIALLHKGIPTLAVVYNPIHNELFEAEKGLGAKLNGKKITVSDISTLKQSLLATGFAYDRELTPDNNYKEFCYMTSQTQGVRRGGAAALDLAFVAAGRLDGFWERGLSPWDMAAGVLLIEEAGGNVTSYTGGSYDLYSGRILASNNKIHDKMVDSLALAKTLT